MQEIHHFWYIRWNVRLHFLIWKMRKKIVNFLYAFISFTFQGWIRYPLFFSGRTLGALVKTIKCSKFWIIVIPVCNLTLPLTLPYFLLYLFPYLIIHLILPYLTIPYVLPYLTISYLNPTLSYLILRATLP